MKMLLVVSAVIIVAAVAGGLVLGGFVSEGFFSGFATSAGSDQAVPDAAADSGDASPGFKIKMGSKTGGASDDGGVDDDTSDAADTAANSSSAVNKTVTLVYFGSDKKKSGGSPNKPEEKPPAVVNNKVYVSPSSVNVGVNDTFNVNVAIYSEVKVYAATIRFTYDTSVLTAVSADQGDFFTQDGAETYRIIKVDNVTGVVSYDNTRFQVAEGVQGEGTILTVTFAAKAPGTSAFTLNDAEILDESIKNIAFKIEGGTVNVQ
jgi:hypothetical protein